MRHSTFTVALLTISMLSTASASEPIRPSEKLPPTTPWNLEKLSEPPAFKWLDAAPDRKVRALLYTGEKYRGNPTEVFAYYATPGMLAGDVSQDKDLPAVVLVHGGGGTAFREWVELWAQRGYAAIAMDLAGHRPIEGQNAHRGENRERLTRGGPNQGDDEKFGCIENDVTEQWPYHAVASVIRAHSLVRSFPEVDAERTAITGISWGGYLTCITASVDNRFKAAVPVYGCGFLYENSAWLDRFAAMNSDQRQRWIELWDPSRYLPAVSMPILFVNGTNDFAYPLDSYMKSYDLVRSFKQLCVKVNMPHSHPDGWAPMEIGLFIDQHLRGSEALAYLDEVQMIDSKVHVSFRSVRPVREAALHMTMGSEPINQRQWTTIAARLEGQTIVVDSPPADVTAWFVTATDDRGAIVSTRTIFPSK